ncbi:acetylglutamate kinase [Weizmannia acidilactici]|uniref:acetylglutamate kinase n=1 Tax=Weizmannia acidilactici TaxID=2607726 RepID=UPI00124E2B1E|nr:acetylglutamate kinase [Weizmannia acidilactici]GER67710.1 acetylglutamate kinase [Weizmannia acidilactici]
MPYVVIKCGGSILNQLPDAFFENILQIKQQYQLDPIIVHGGGPAISAALEKMRIKTRFINGMRVTTEPVLNVVEMVLSGSINKSITRKLSSMGAKAIGISGTDCGLLTAKKLDYDKLGFVGEIESVNSHVLQALLGQQFIPVISPLALSKNGQRLNINADLAAAAIAKKMNAALWMVTDVPSVMHEGKVLPHLTPEQVEMLIRKKAVTGGMIPKVRAAAECIQSGVKEVVIVNGMEENSLLRLAGGGKMGTKFTGNGVLIDG